MILVDVAVEGAALAPRNNELWYDGAQGSVWARREATSLHEKDKM